MYLEIYGLAWLFLGALIGYAAASERGWSPVGGVIGGALLGILSPLLFFVSGITHSDQSKKCPQCAENVKVMAKVCRFCGHDFVLINEDDTAGLPQQVSTDLDDVTDTHNHPESIFKVEDGILSTSCPHCNYELKILENRLGSEVLCSSCRKLIKISTDGSCGSGASIMSDYIDEDFQFDA